MVFLGSTFLDGSVSLLGRILFGGGGCLFWVFTLIASLFLSTWRPGILSWEFRGCGQGTKAEVLRHQKLDKPLSVICEHRAKGSNDFILAEGTSPPLQLISHQLLRSG